MKQAGESASTDVSGSRLPPNNFDFLRFFFASMVVFSHSYPLATGTEELEPLARLTNRQLTFGSLAVDCFFIISGYLIAQSWLSKPKISLFLSKRIRRIYPGFIVAATIGAFVLAPVFSQAGVSALTRDFAFEFVGKVVRLIAVQPTDAFPHNPAPGPTNGSLWSISFEFWCYIGAMTAGLIGILRKTQVLAYILAAAIACSFIFSWYDLRLGGKILGTIFGYPPIWARILPYFLVGMLFHSLRNRLRLNSRGAVICALVLAGSTQIAYAFIVTLPICAAYLIFWVAFLPSNGLGNFAKYGDASYGIYLYSFPIEQIIMAWYGDKMSHTNLFLLAWPLSILIAFLSWHMVEKHFLKPKSALSAPTIPSKVRAV